MKALEREADHAYPLIDTPLHGSNNKAKREKVRRHRRDIRSAVRQRLKRELNEIITESQDE